MELNNLHNKNKKLSFVCTTDDVFHNGNIAWFADKNNNEYYLNLDRFDTDIIIVGPQGSGKTYFLDAVVDKKKGHCYKIIGLTFITDTISIDKAFADLDIILVDEVIDYNMIIAARDKRCISSGWKGKYIFAVQEKMISDTALELIPDCLIIKLRRAK